MKYSILTTVYDREPELLLATLRSLYRCDLTDCELIVVNDGSHMDYSWVKQYIDARFDSYQWIDAPEYEAFRIEGGFNNPARAFNLALEAATGDNVVILSSDVMVGPKVLDRMRRIPLIEMAWTPLVIDIESGAQYCGPLRMFPMPWCLAADRQHCIDIGGWDETYLKGMCFEDNDFVGRLVLKTGRFLGDWTVVAYHQSHDQPAYKVLAPEVKDANDRNKRYTLSKWTGIPFSAEYIPFDIIRKPYETGDVVHECIAASGLLEKVITKTSGIIADRVRA